MTLFSTDLARIKIHSVCLSLSEISQTQYARQRPNSKKRVYKLATEVHVFSNMHDVAFSRCCFAMNGNEMNKEL